jgi:group I intron endonuclease
MEITIYKITSPSGKNYVGRTNNFGGRMNEHKSESTRERRYHYPLYKAVRKYGWDNMEITELVKCSKEDMYDLELHYINKYNGFDGYNTQRDTTQGGDVWEDRYDTKEYKDFVDKMSKLNSGYKNGMFGKKHSDEAIQKQKQKAKGRFSLDWYIDRNGKQEGTRLYEERRQFLKNRNLKKDKYGRFISKTSQ